MLNLFIMINADRHKYAFEADWNDFLQFKMTILWIKVDLKDNEKVVFKVQNKVEQNDNVFIFKRAELQRKL